MTAPPPQNTWLLLPLYLLVGAGVVVLVMVPIVVALRLDESS